MTVTVGSTIRSVAGLNRGFSPIPARSYYLSLWSLWFKFFKHLFLSKSARVPAEADGFISFKTEAFVILEPKHRLSAEEVLENGY